MSGRWKGPPRLGQDFLPFFPLGLVTFWRYCSTSPTRPRFFFSFAQLETPPRSRHPRSSRSICSSVSLFALQKKKKPTTHPHPTLSLSDNVSDTPDTPPQNQRGAFSTSTRSLRRSVSRSSFFLSNGQISVSFRPTPPNPCKRPTFSRKGLDVFVHNWG